MSTEDEAAMNEIRPTFIVTGGSRGIGRAVVTRLARMHQPRLFVQYCENTAAAMATQQVAEQAGADVHVIQANFHDMDEVERMCSRIIEMDVRIDGLVHCAALTNFKPAMMTKPQHLTKVFAMNTASLLALVQMLNDAFNETAAIVALSSLGARRVLSDYGAMGPVKASLETLVRYLAAELGGRGIRVNAVSAGLIETDSLLRFSDYGAMKERAEALTPFKRLGTVDEIASIVDFLLHDDAKWITGQTLVADGGMSLR